MMKTVFVACIALTAVAGDRITMESDRAETVHGWTSTGSANGDHQLKMTFAIKQNNLDVLRETALQVSDPNHARYGKHLSLEEVNQLVAPKAEALGEVLAFLHDFGVISPEMNGKGDMLTFVANVSLAEQMLNVRYHEYFHNNTGNKVVRTEEGLTYSLPDSVAQHIDFISPTVHFPPQGRKARIESSAPLRLNTPASLRKLYKVGNITGLSKENRQACTAFLGQFYKQTDLDKFWSKYYPKLSGETINVIGPDSGSAGVEASLDIEYISAMGAKVETEFWSFAGRAPGNPENEPFLDFIYLVGNTSDDKVPKVFSTSYGECENTVGYAYLERINVEFQKAAARGISLLFASGDSGVGADSGICKGGRFCGQWPAGSPWVTGVGGTASATQLGAEDAWSGSSGGFSDRFDGSEAPWQQAAVATYFSTASNLPAKTHYNATSRGFPDVSAQATGFTVVNGGFTVPGVAGTSCASPTFTGIVSLLNDLRLQQGKSVLGFLNPFFYQHAAAFNDITTGNNPGCDTDGFEAAKGWDPVTGLGSPNYEKLAAAVASLP